MGSRLREKGRDETCVELWYVRLGQLEAHTDWVRDRVPEKERTEYGLMGNRDEALRSLYARAFLREIVGRRLGLDPKCVPLTCSEKGKPLCEHVNFSCARTTEAALIAIGGDFAVGVDLEKSSGICDEKTYPCFARFFHEEEKVRLEQVEVQARPAAVLRLWLRKEAVVKACGERLLLHLRHIVCSSEKDETRVEFRDENDCSFSWWHCPLITLESHTAAVAVPSEIRVTIRPRVFHF